LGEEQNGEAEAEERRVFAAGAGRAPAPYSHKGSIDEWRQNVGALCVRQSAVAVRHVGRFCRAAAGADWRRIGRLPRLWQQQLKANRHFAMHMAASVFGKPADYSKILAD
jgi:hypothetical protein